MAGTEQLGQQALEDMCAVKGAIEDAFDDADKGIHNLEMTDQELNEWYDCLVCYTRQSCYRERKYIPKQKEE